MQVDHINPNNFKIRCSGIHMIMGATGITDIQKAKIKELQAKAKISDKQQAELDRLLIKQANPGLPTGAASYCDNWIKEQLYNRRREFHSKYTSKGTTQEDLAIDFGNDVLGWGFAEKNTKEYSNGFITGTPDVILPKKIADVKSPWDCFTFPLFDEETEVPFNYWCQGQGYMCLLEKEAYELVYVLLDAPEELVQREAKSKFWELYKQTEIPTEFYEQVKQEMTYSDLPAEYRVKKFNFTYNEDFMLSVVARVKMCRSYITDRLEYLKTVNNFILN